MKYAAMINMPGYMPDCDIESFKTKKACREYLEAELLRAYEDIEGDDNIALQDEINKAIRELKRHGFTYYHGYYYGIN